MKAAAEVLSEPESVVVERHIARERDRARDELFARTGWTMDQGGEFAHLLIERPTVASHVVSEDRLPDRGPEICGRLRISDDVGEHVMKRRSNLEIDCPGMARIVARGKREFRTLHAVLPQREKLPIKRR